MGVFAALRVFFLGLYLGRVLDHVMATGLGTQILDFLGSTAAATTNGILLPRIIRVGEHVIVLTLHSDILNVNAFML
jgi:hypothetical protein